MRVGGMFVASCPFARMRIDRTQFPPRFPRPLPLALTAPKSFPELVPKRTPPASDSRLLFSALGI